ncbi:exodeoxyribonuclease VII large subunit [bacterium]|nr:exodeoxyribonuclease VII large subunit [bacterium]
MEVSKFFSQLNTMLTRTAWTKQICIVGEVASAKLTPGGHYFFNLKDDQCSLHCKIFSFSRQRYGAAPNNGERIVAYGSINSYGGYSEICLKVSRYERDGQGLLLFQLEQLKEKLRREHLFDDDRKRPLPKFPRVIGLVTSDSGMAFGDIVKRFRERAPHVRLWLVPALVQGASAPASMISALHYLESLEEVDAIILGRGGGSSEDLMAFNDERLVRAVAACSKPIVTAIGHDGDNSLCDLAADKIASTPTNAAEVIVPLRDELLKEVRSQYSHALMRMQIFLQFQRQKVEALSQRCQLSKPQQRIEHNILYLDTLRTQLAQIGQNLSKRQHHELELVRAKAGWRKPAELIDRYRQEVANWQKRYEEGLIDRIYVYRIILENIRTRIRSLDPHLALQRGYSIVSDSQGRPIVSINELTKGQSIRFCLQDGQAIARVEDVSPALPTRTQETPSANDQENPQA